MKYDRYDLCPISYLGSEMFLHVFRDCGQAMQVWKYCRQVDNDPLFLGSTLKEWFRYNLTSDGKFNGA